MAMVMLRNKYISVTHVLYHLYLALGGFCAAYKFAVAVLSMSIARPTGSLNVTGSVGEEPVEEASHLCVAVQNPGEGERQRELSALYGQNRRLSLRYLPLAEGSLSNRGESIRRPRPN